MPHLWSYPDLVLAGLSLTLAEALAEIAPEPVDLVDLAGQLDARIAGLPTPRPVFAAVRLAEWQTIEALLAVYQAQTDDDPHADHVAVTAFAERIKSFAATSRQSQTRLVAGMARSLDQQASTWWHDSRSDRVPPATAELTAADALLRWMLADLTIAAGDGIVPPAVRDLFCGGRLGQSRPTLDLFALYLLALITNRGFLMEGLLGQPLQLGATWLSADAVARQIADWGRRRAVDVNDRLMLALATPSHAADSATAKVDGELEADETGLFRIACSSLSTHHARQVAAAMAHAAPRVQDIARDIAAIAALVQALPGDMSQLAARARAVGSSLSARAFDQAADHLNARPDLGLAVLEEAIEAEGAAGVRRDLHVAACSFARLLVKPEREVQHLGSALAAVSGDRVADATAAGPSQDHLLFELAAALARARRAQSDDALAHHATGILDHLLERWLAAREPHAALSALMLRSRFALELAQPAERAAVAARYADRLAEVLSWTTEGPDALEFEARLERCALLVAAGGPNAGIAHAEIDALSHSAAIADPGTSGRLALVAAEAWVATARTATDKTAAVSAFHSAMDRCWKAMSIPLEAADPFLHALLADKLGEAALAVVNRSASRDAAFTAFAASRQAATVITPSIDPARHVDLLIRTAHSANILARAKAEAEHWRGVAVSHFRRAITHLTLQGDPMKWGQTHLSLANTLFADYRSTRPMRLLWETIASGRQASTGFSAAGAKPGQRGAHLILARASSAAGQRLNDAKHLVQAFVEIEKLIALGPENTAEIAGLQTLWRSMEAVPGSTAVPSAVADMTAKVGIDRVATVATAIARLGAERPAGAHSVPDDAAF